MLETYPYLPDGTPFPTLLYLTCPSAVDVAGEVESRGGVAELRERVVKDAGLSLALSALEEAYRGRRRRLAEFQNRSRAVPAGRRIDAGEVLEAGIGGPTPPERATCLHALIAALLVFAGERGGGSGAGGAGDSEAPSTDHVAKWRALLESFGPLWCMDVRCAHYLPQRDRRAVIDVGTNSVRLLVAQVSGPKSTDYQVLAREASVTRLGEGLRPGMSLRPEATERTRRVVGEYVFRARTLGAQTITLIATSAAREAADGRAFVERLGHEHGVRSVVVTGEQEARLTYLGAGDLGESQVLVDPGGGSTEIIWRGADGSMAERSAAAGAVRMSEGYLHNDPPTTAERRAARAAAWQAFDDAFVSMPVLPRAETVVGVAGTVTSLACLALDLPAYDPEQVHGSELSRERVSELVDRLAAMSEAERAQLTCIQPGRAAVMVGGGEVVLAAMDFLGAERLIVSERDLLDGALLAEQGGADWRAEP